MQKRIQHGEWYNTTANCSEAVNEGEVIVRNVVTWKAVLQTHESFKHNLCYQYFVQ